MPNNPPFRDSFGFNIRRGPSTSAERPLVGLFAAPPAEPAWPETLWVGNQRFDVLRPEVNHQSMPPCELTAAQHTRVGQPAEEFCRLPRSIPTESPMAIRDSSAPVALAGPQCPRTADPSLITSPVANRQPNQVISRNAPPLPSEPNHPPFRDSFGLSVRRGPSTSAERPLVGLFAAPPAEPAWPETMWVGNQRFDVLRPEVDYQSMPPCELTAEQRKRVGEFDPFLSGRPLEALQDPVAIFSGQVAHVYEHEFLMKWWRKNRTHPATSERLEATAFRRVVSPPAPLERWAEPSAPTAQSSEG
ncbi:hypothetical protein JCM11251_005021 [Rhodosporidiobolus azoricus]